MEKSHKIFSYSKTRIVLILLLSLSLVLVMTLLGGQIIGKIGLSIGGGIGAIFGLINVFIAPKYLAKSVWMVYYHDSSFEMTCIKPFWGSKKGKMISIRYDDIKSYKFDVTNNFSTLRVILKDGTVRKLHKWYNDDNDQFEDFIATFNKNIKVYNNKRNSTEKVEKEKSIFENRTFLIGLAIILFLIVLTTVVLLFTRGIQNKFGLVFISMVLAPLVWVIRNVIEGFKNN